MAYTDIREHLRQLEENHYLIRIKRPINKDTEMHPLVRLQFRGGIPADERKAFLFENVTDSRGKNYSTPVVVGALAASPKIYAIGMQCKEEEVAYKWQQALYNLTPPVVVQNGPAQEVVLTGDQLKQSGGLDELPIPISTPGWDNAPYTTCSVFVSKDPETGVYNLGNYRGQLKAPDRMGVYPIASSDLKQHWVKCRERGEPLQVALVIGAPPIVYYAAVQKIPPHISEYDVAGALAGEPIRLIRCKTIDLEVPAESEFVIEGIVPTDVLEPFGESHGHMNPRELCPFMQVTAITHRYNPVWVSFISQVTPAKSSVIKKVGYQPLFFDFLKNQIGIRSLVRIHMWEPLVNLRKMVVLQLKKPSQSETWRALFAAANYNRGVGKIVIAVDEDINPESSDALWWALCYRMQPDKDIQYISGREKGHAPPFLDIELNHADKDFQVTQESAILINAVLKEPFPPYLSLKKNTWKMPFKFGVNSVSLN